MAELALREVSVEDATAIAGYLDEYERATTGEKGEDEAVVRHWFELPDVWFAAAERGERIVGYLDISAEAEHGRWQLDVRALEPEIADFLLACAESRARERAPDVLLRGYAAPGDATAASLERAGFRVIRSSYEMRIELGAAPSPPGWPEGIAVRAHRPGEEQRVYEAHQEAFEDHWDYRRPSKEEWRAWSVESPQYDPSLWIVAEAGEEIAGLAICAWHDSGDPAFGWVHVLGVRRPWRRRGLGEALLRHAFAEFGRRGATRVGLGVDAENTSGAVGLYERAGMHVVHRSDTYEKRL